jgi:hypothetical protein
LSESLIRRGGVGCRDEHAQHRARAHAVPKKRPHGRFLSPMIAGDVPRDMHADRVVLDFIGISACALAIAGA